MTGGAGLTDAPGVPSWRLSIAGGFGPKIRPIVLEVKQPPPETEEADDDPDPPSPSVVEVHVTQKGGSLAELIEDRIVVYEQVFFHEGRAEILPRSEPVLKAVADVLEANPDIEFLLIEGHTNHHGSQDYNLRLSDQRAAAVGRWLEWSAGIDGARLLTKGYGFSRPLLPKDAPQAVIVNRRVEFVVVRPDENHHDGKVPVVVEVDE